jgi:menaquinone-dependent protoporphyrinogen oxidase
MKNMTNFLIVYSSTDGQTLKICHELQTIIEQQQHHQVVLVPVDQADRINVSNFDKIVIGASIRYGHHNPKIHTFIEQNRLLLDSKPNAFFSVNVVARKPEKCTPETNPYLRKFLKRIPLKPKVLAVFAGKLDYPSYKVFDRTVIRLIMWMTNGPTDPNTVVEYTDWDQVEAFGKLISLM